MIFASYAGAPVDPAWFHNLVAHPEVTVEIGAGTRRSRARVAEGTSATSLRSGTSRTTETFREYETKTDRKIPVVILEPVAMRAR